MITQDLWTGQACEDSDLVRKGSCSGFWHAYGEWPKSGRAEMEAVGLGRNKACKEKFYVVFKEVGRASRQGLVWCSLLEGNGFKMWGRLTTLKLFCRAWKLNLGPQTSLDAAVSRYLCFKLFVFLHQKIVLQWRRVTSTKSWPKPRRKIGWQ